MFFLSQPQSFACLVFSLSPNAFLQTIGSALQVLVRALTLRLGIALIALSAGYSSSQGLSLPFSASGPQRQFTRPGESLAYLLWRRPRYLCIAGMPPNNAFKPKPLRSTKHMAGKACHVFGSTMQFGLTWALGTNDRSAQIVS